VRSWLTYRFDFKPRILSTKPATMAAVTNEREIQPMQLSLEQLSSLKTQHENEIQELQRQMESLFGAKTRYNNAKAVLGDMSTCPAGNSLLIPLNSSLYVPGKIINPDKVWCDFISRTRLRIRL
jgi:prefoldin alpha subunit